MLMNQNVQRVVTKIQSRSRSVIARSKSPSKSIKGVALSVQISKILLQRTYFRKGINTRLQLWHKWVDPRACVIPINGTELQNT